ncbi:MAG TPA: hypothetical protein VJY42_03025 [Candidatus Methanomethylophilaceae archaeon]|nr:hypothetical protein [Candidatus Methanomethylophilaceae archaeon]
MDHSKREEMLIEASIKLREASELIKNALHMSELNCRGEEILNTIEHYTSNNDDSCSIPNILRDLESVDNEPCWSRPFASVKQFDRKDI